MLVGSADGFAKPVPLHDKNGKRMHTGRYWDTEAKKHTSGTGPGGRAYSAFPLDWDGDGDFDLLVGTDKGGVYLRVNEGTKTEPAFASETTGTDVSVPGGYAMPVAADWDGDGRWDLVSGSQSGAVYWFRNVGKIDDPKFGKARQLVARSNGRDDSPGQRTQVDVADFDGDGDLDLLVGDNRMKREGQKYTFYGYVWLYRRTAKTDTAAKGTLR